MGPPPHFHPKFFLTKLTQNGLKWILNTTLKSVTFCRRYHLFNCDKFCKDLFVFVEFYIKKITEYTLFCNLWHWPTCVLIVFISQCLFSLGSCSNVVKFIFIISKCLSITTCLFYFVRIFPLNCILTVNINQDSI